ncbi:MAG TPA: 3-phosphoshikimate 1-carboxyvinyltransferase [Bacteroidaceae bacterium]|nr:3-phosphoshikimate 1-carboxyvinyltransferase [Bacteroidaceae bacterium]
MKFMISKPRGTISGKIYLPASKSISNRLLIMEALSEERAELINLAESDDTLLLKEALHSGNDIIDIGHAGTAMRFLTAYYASGNRKVILTGSERMKRRPIGELVDALIYLGGKIEYLGNPGFPPLKIKGTLLKSGVLSVDSSISSQFISALLMIAPGIRNGLEIELKGKIVSGTYIRMTLELMKTWGIDYSWTGNRIKVYEGHFKTGSYTVESDWSAGSYWYAIAFLSDGAVINLPFLFRESLQGDAVVSELFNKLLLDTDYLSGGITISKKPEQKHPDNMVLDFTLCPDLVQTMATVLCASGIHFHFTGTQTLKIKETDRIKALQKELGKFGFLLRTNEEGNFLTWKGEMCETDPSPEIDTCNDHRMAMAFAPLALKFDTVVIKDPMVVTKSYPHFWEDLRKVGFGIEEIDGSNADC